MLPCWRDPPHHQCPGSHAAGHDLPRGQSRPVLPGNRRRGAERPVVRPFPLLPPPALAATWRCYERLDELRRRQGRWLDALGFGPQPSPSRVVLRQPGLTLKAYGAPDRTGPVILLVPAPIKRAYLWDLAPGASVVEQCLNAGARVYLLHWEEPQPALGLADYGDRLLRACVEAIGAETGAEPLFLVGHSLSGMLVVMFAALYPACLRGLVLLTAPLHFELTGDAGRLGPVIAAVARSGLLEAAPGNWPGSFLSLAGFLAAPATFGRDRLLDGLYSWPDRAAREMHLRVERWSLDELPLARQLVADVVQHLYREDGFLRGTLAVGGRTAAARAVVTPVLIVADRRCAIVPPAAIRPFAAAAGTPDLRWLWYEGDVGVALQHLGVLIGRHARQRLWPEILRWIEAHHR